jgi:hypothetical protein
MLMVGLVTDAEALIPADSAWLAPRLRADRLYAHGLLAVQRGDRARAARLHNEALALNPYHMRARLLLVRLLTEQQKRSEADRIVAVGRRLLGPSFQKETARCCN